MCRIARPATGRQAEPDRRAGDHFAGSARAFSGGGSCKTLCERGGIPVLISMIDENVNQSIQDSINELKSQLVSKVIINVPLEAEEAQKIATDNDDIVCLFWMSTRTVLCLTFRLTRRMGPAPALNTFTSWAIATSPCWRGRSPLCRHS